MAHRSIHGTYENRELGMCVDLEFPIRPGESFEDGLQRICTAVRDGLGIKPAPAVDPLEWARIQKRVSGKPSP